LIVKISATAAKEEKTAKITPVEKIGENFFEKYRAWGLYVNTDATQTHPKRTCIVAYAQRTQFCPHFSAFSN
tara:strand:+ start:997 stop:1212 length:216 start_codon:yes stop_codon:yes gene_type:complete